jgi:hypothetical protein
MGAIITVIIIIDIITVVIIIIIIINATNRQVAGSIPDGVTGIFQ